MVNNIFKKKKHKLQVNLIKDTYDYRCPKPVFNELNIKQGVGCVICEIHPLDCPYFENDSLQCNCKDKCTYHYKYKPNKIYKTKESIINHLETHNLKISDDILDFYNLS